MNNTDRMPPANPDAERGILATCLRNNLVIPDAVRLLKADDFHVDANRKIFEGITALGDKGKRVDAVTVGEWLVKRHELDEVGGKEYLAKLVTTAPTAHIEHYAELIRDNKIARDMIQAAADTQIDAWSPHGPMPEMLALAEQRLSSIAERSAPGDLVDMPTALRETWDRLQMRKDRGGAGGVMTGFIDLDNILSGFQDSEVTIVGARPSVGKSSIALQFALHAAVGCRLPVLFISLEQSRAELTERLLCMQGRINSHKLRNGHLSYSENNDLLDAGAVLSESPIYLDDSPSQTMMRIAANARRAKRKRGIRLLILDYVQLVESDSANQRQTRQEHVSAVSRRLKFLARELKIPVVACAQLNRAVEDRAGGKPKLSDLRETGSLEQDADAVMLLNRTGDEGDVVEVIVAKNRNGPTGEVMLMYVKQYMRFENYAVANPFAGGGP